MNESSSVNARSWDVLLIGGASGTGKTSVSYRLARYFNVGITEVDDFHLVLEKMTTPEQQPILHYWKNKPESVRLSAEQILGLHTSVGRVMLPALTAVVVNHVVTNTPVVLEGDYILPEVMAQGSRTSGWKAERVRAVFLYEPDEKQIIENYYLREPESGKQAQRAHVSWLYGEWLRNECERYGLKALPATPWDTLFDRFLEAIR